MSESDIKDLIIHLIDSDRKINELEQENQQLKEQVDNCISNEMKQQLEISKLRQENQQLKERINTYENPEDLTLMFMYCDEKAKDRIKQYKSVLDEIRDYCKFGIKEWITDDGFVEEVLGDILQILDKVKE